MGKVLELIDTVIIEDNKTLGYLEIQDRFDDILDTKIMEHNLDTDLIHIELETDIQEDKAIYKFNIYEAI